MLHGVENYVIKGEGSVGGALIPEPTFSARGAGFAPAVARDPFETREKKVLAPKQLFCRLFDKGPQPDAAALIELGLEMEHEIGEGGSGGGSRDSSIPAGFTYFGQFVDHDITFDRTPLSITGSVDPEEAANNRTPALDLDSIYGGGPDVSPHLYAADGVSLLIGVCTPSEDQAGASIGTIPNDLPRRDTIAIIGDPRNDENLALAQLHLAFLKFHNATVQEMKAKMPSLGAPALFRKAREKVILSYQRIVLRDFLSKVIDFNAVESVFKSGFRIFKAQDHHCMPVEFSVAAYRFGHSMIRPVYDWNRVFNSGGSGLAEGSLQLLFEFTHFSGATTPGDSGFFGAETLPSNWAVNWKLFFDIEGNPPPSGLKFNHARRIDTNLAFPLKTLPEFAGAGVTDPAMLSLASRNLLRGRLMELPDGLTVAQHIKDAGIAFTPLTAEQLRGGPRGPKLEEVGLLDSPPLWYYILREAELQEGERLGPVGSRIVAETLMAHIRAADVSVLADMSVDGVFDVERFTMSDLLRKVNDLAPV